MKLFLKRVINLEIMISNNTNIVVGAVMETAILF